MTGIILAAGRSERMGRPKQLLPLGGRPMLQHVLDTALDSRLNEIILVLGHRADEILAALRLPADGQVRVVTNHDHAQGQSTSLRLGLLSANPSAAAAAILLGDQPSVDAPLIDRVAAAFLSAGCRAARAVYDNASGSKFPGHPVLLAREIWPEVMRLEGDQGARDLFTGHPEWLLNVPIDGTAPADIDTWEEYEAQRGLTTPGGCDKSSRH